MNITFFTPTLNAGGYEKVVITFANELSKYSENNITVLCGDDDGELKYLIGEQVKIECLNCRTRNLLPKLIFHCIRNSIDVFYSGFRVYNAIAVCAKVLSKSKMKICASQHGYEYDSKLKTAVLGKIIQKADLFVGVTNSVMNYEVNSLHLQCRKVVIGNPVISNYEIREVNNTWFDSEIPVIVTCGRLSRDKNYLLALGIVQYLNERNHVFRLLIIGSGPEEEALKQKIDELKLGKYVRMIGYVPDPISYMKKCDIYLHTCDREGFGNTVVEAMYAGLPIVTTDCGGPVDLIENDKYGVCFGKGHCFDAAKNGAEAILKVTKHMELYQNQKEKALQFCAPLVSKHLLEEFKALL